MPDRPNVIISSTALDLPGHREEVMEACQRQGMFPYMMEHLPAQDADARQVSEELVDKADIYLGIFAHRYGYVPAGDSISITEMEYNRAVERGIPCLIFLMHDDHDLKAADVEKGEGAVKLEALKQRLGTRHVVNHFKSPADLRALVINALAQHRERDLTTFHYISDIPTPPETYIAHPYTLLQTSDIKGRNAELNLLTDWVAKPGSDIYKAHVLDIVAIGGMGKSALTWKWFNDIAPQEMKPLAGRMWWSFYESDATFENFVIRALAYTTRRAREEVQKIPAPERETQLLAALKREPFLLVLDGLERILIAYARMDAAHLSDDDFDKRTASVAVRGDADAGLSVDADTALNAVGLPASADETAENEHRLRKTADPRAGAFLRKLAGVRASRILISTRLHPADLQKLNGEPLDGCATTHLHGLSDDDALDLWRAFGASGARDTLLPLFNRFDNHPLLIQALASMVARYRPAPGDFERWRQDHPDFNPFTVPLKNVKTHVLAYALHGLDDKPRRLLHTVAAFRAPARYDTIAALALGDDKICADERDLDAVLTELEERGLLGWDKPANRYDLHPIVRGVVWSGLSKDAQRGIYTTLHAYFEAFPKIDHWQEINNLEDLTPAIELYNTLVGLGRYDDACDVYRERLEGALLYRLNANHHQAQLIEMVFPDGTDELLQLTDQNQGYALSMLAIAYNQIGRPGQAVTLHRQVVPICEKKSDMSNLVAALNNLSNSLRLIGVLREAEAVTRRALTIIREQSNVNDTSGSLFYLGAVLAIRGKEYESAPALDAALKIALQFAAYRPYDYLAERALLFGQFNKAREWADKAMEFCQRIGYESGIICATRIQGVAALGLNESDRAEELLNNALTRARAGNLVEEELPTLVALAELRRQQGDVEGARELLDDVWEGAERGPYPLFHADALNVLAQIERDVGESEKAIEAAQAAYRLAWCDGPPFAYHMGLETARAHLRELGATEPEMPPFDESKFEPMPEVEIEPPDEVKGGEQKKK